MKGRCRGQEAAEAEAQGVSNLGRILGCSSCAGWRPSTAGRASEHCGRRLRGRQPGCFWVWAQSGHPGMKVTRKLHAGVPPGVLGAPFVATVWKLGWNEAPALRAPPPANSFASL